MNEDNGMFGKTLPPMFDLVGPGGVDDERAFEHGYLAFYHGWSPNQCPLSKESFASAWGSWVLGWDEAYLENMGEERSLH